MSKTEIIDFSVIIRTTGKAKEKYKELLFSISKLDPQPKEIIVVLPEGYNKPEDKLGIEKFYFCPRGMVKQRLVGIEKCKTKYALVCDDDIKFNSDFIRQLYMPIKNGEAKISAGPLYSFLPNSLKSTLLCWLMGSEVPTLFNKDKYITVLRTTGFSYNKKLNLGCNYYSESVAWTCFFCDVNSIRSIKLEEEIWLDKNGYSALDDQTMFYKAWLNNMKTIVVPSAIYEHLDAKTSTLNNRKPVLYSFGFNRVVFWHRFIFSQEQKTYIKFWSVFCILYRFIWILIFDCINLMFRKITLNDLKVKICGFYDGIRYLSSEEYNNFSSVKVK